MFYQNDIVRVLIPIAVGDGYDYRLGAPAGIGQFVRVSVMNKPYIGVIVGGGASELPPEKIKPAIPITNYQLPITTLTWIIKMSEWTMMPPGLVLRLIVNVPEAFDPPKTEQLYILSIPEKMRMTESRQAIADAFASNDNEPMSANDIQNIAHVSPTSVRTMIKNEILKPVAERATITNYQLPITNYYNTGAVTLNAEQQAAADAIMPSENHAHHSNFQVFLLDGITGSGKTQVYFDSTWRVYSAGKSVLLMMPEIALTAQFMSRFANRFGAPPVIWHSNLTSARRRDIWRGVASGDIRIVVGTRSALFLPWQDLGLIVVDEEHDNSYKQEDMGNYHARDMAILRAKTEGFPIVLASATPAAETLRNVVDGRYEQLKLTSRFGGATMPTIETIDMRQEKLKSHTPSPSPVEGQPSNGEELGPSNLKHISPALCTAIDETLAAGQQAMLFINRRGHSPIVQCKVCGWHADCPDCSVGMALHKKLGRLLCHCCGRTMPIPTKCPDCGAAEISTSGIGVEKIEDEVHTRWPNARTAIVSSDTMMSRQALERLVTKMESGEIDIVIGTQILAKGHHFPNLTLVGVVDADMGLFGADFRAGEKTFQQLFQVAGRAGRGDKPGRVLLQTYQPEHPVLRAICAGDRDELMRIELAGRKAASMPPYGQLIAVIVEGQKENVLQDFCRQLSNNAPKLVDNSTHNTPNSTLKILGPIPAQIYQIRNWYRMRFLVCGPQHSALQPAVKAWLDKVKTPANVKIKIDVNPQSFM